MNITQRTKTICVIELNLVLNNVSSCELVAVPNPPRAKIEPMRYTYLGPSGTFTESALLSVPGVVGAERIPATSVPNALERLRSGDVDAAMVPIENSVEGGVSATLDAIAASEGMRIIREVLVPIRFVLVAARPLALEDIKTVSTHSHAWPRYGNGDMTTIPPADGTCPVPPPRQQPWVCLTLPVRMMPRFVPPALFGNSPPTCMCLPKTLVITKKRRHPVCAHQQYRGYARAYRRR